MDICASNVRKYNFEDFYLHISINNTLYFFYINLTAPVTYKINL